MKESKTWINVLLVDDDANYADTLTLAAEDNSIALTHCPFWDEAFQHISQNPHGFDVIVLDGKGQINANTETADLNHLKKALHELALLEGKGIAIPYVVNTGYVEESALGYGVEVFKKGPTQQDKLFHRLRELSNQSISYRMRCELPEVATVFEEHLLGRTAELIFLNVFASLEKKSLGTYDPRNDLRKVLEAFCKTSGQLGLIEGRISGIQGHRNLESCCLYIAGIEVKFPSLKDYTQTFKAHPNPFPNGIAHCFRFIMDDTQPASHFSAGNLCSPHLARALFHALCEILSWLQKYAADHPDPEENRKSIRVTAVNPR